MANETGPDGTYRDTKETRERLVDRMRGSGIDKKTANRLAEQSVGRVEDTLARKGK